MKHDSLTLAVMNHIAQTIYASTDVLDKEDRSMATCLSTMIALHRHEVPVVEAMTAALRSIGIAYEMSKEELSQAIRDHLERHPHKGDTNAK